MKRITFTISILIVCFSTASKIFAQSVPVGMPVLDDYYRRSQLLGKLDSNVSFSLRPLTTASRLNVQDVFDPDTMLKKDHWVQLGPVSFANGKGVFQILPLSLQQQFNSNHPYGWNDGPMIPAKGYQTLVSGGFYLKYGPLSIQLRPEYVYAANPAFNGYASGHTTATDFSNYYSFHNLIDNPERFGNGAYSKAFLGQSNVLLTFGPAQIGLSSENLWWGPGISNSLMMTNNAPGFLHITLNTARPVKTIIGSFEAQVIAAHLNNSGYQPLLPSTLPSGITNSFDPFKDDWRYLTGFNINYHPKWIPGFTLGFTRTFDAYYSDVKTGGFSAYVPFFITFLKQNDNNGLGDTFPRDQITSFYARWLFPKAQAELYFEYGLEDNSYNINDFIGSPDHSRAYIFGFRKMFPISGTPDQHIMFSSEITQTSQHVDATIRETGLWYLNYQERQGYTNDGQVIGAGTGPGGNIQSMDLSWVSGLKKLGFEFQRYEHDVDFSNEVFPPINGNSRNWVDLAFALKAEWNYKNFLFNAKIQEIESLNYEWILKNYNPSQYYIPNNTVYNLHAELGMTFRF